LLPLGSVTCSVDHVLLRQKSDYLFCAIVGKLYMQMAQTAKKCIDFRCRRHFAASDNDGKTPNTSFCIEHTISGRFFMIRLFRSSSSPPARSVIAWSWGVGLVTLTCLGFFLVVGEYRAQSIVPQQEIFYDDLLQDPSSSSLTARSSLYDPQKDPAKDVCNTACQRLGQELQSLLWVMTAEKTTQAFKAPKPVSSKTKPRSPLPAVPSRVDPSRFDPAWEPLVKRLVADGFDKNYVLAIFASLGSKSYTPAYMAAKVRELYGVSGVGITRAESGPLPPADYQQPLSDVTLGSCLAFMKRHAGVLKDIERKHGVPARYILGLLLVETGLGSDLGAHSALRALACMANTDTLARLSSGGNGRQARYVRPKALAATLREKSNWAYKEVKALIAYGLHNNIDAASIPGSIYGAIGISQFMPSNVGPFGVDGDKNGRVDLFSVVDAMYSVANYLEANGWRGAKSDRGKLAVFRSYNNDHSYAASVLASSNQIALAQKGKLAHSRNALAGVVVGPRVSGKGFLDPSLRRLKPVPESAKLKLDSYYP
jgi:membrane-bound lytic murein transglycosylase B